MSAAKPSASAVSLLVPGDYFDPFQPDSDDAYTCKVGGLPCAVCRYPLALLLQLYAPTQYERCLYCWACNNAGCHNKPGSWRILRVECNQLAPVVKESASNASDASPAAAASAPAAAAAPKSNISFALNDDWGDGEDASAAAAAASLQYCFSSAHSPPSAPARSAAAPATNAPASDRNLLDRFMQAMSADPSLVGGHGIPEEEEEEQDGGDGADEEDEKQSAVLPAAGHSELTGHPDSRGHSAVAELPPQARSPALPAPAAAQATEGSSAAAVSAVSAAAEHQPSAASGAVVYRPFYLLDEEEPAKTAKKDTFDKEMQLLAAYMEEEKRKKTDPSGGAVGLPEVWAEKYVKTGDVTLEKFTKRMNRQPLQCVRYEMGGEPLWMNDDKPQNIPPCPCGAARVFECQLMPNLLNELRILRPSECAGRPAGCDWSTAAVFVCSRGCERGKYVDEFVHVQSA